MQRTVSAQVALLRTCSKIMYVPTEGVSWVVASSCSGLQCYRLGTTVGVGLVNARPLGKTVAFSLSSWLTPRSATHQSKRRSNKQERNLVTLNRSSQRVQVAFGGSACNHGTLKRLRANQERTKSPISCMEALAN